MAVEALRTVTIGEIAPFIYGKALPERDRESVGKVRVYGSNGVVGAHTAPLTDGPTVIVGRKGTVGAVHYSPDACWPIDTTFFVQGSEEFPTRFLYYLLSSVGLEHMNSDSAVPGLNREAAHALQVVVPATRSGRERIAHILGTLDDKIELNRRMSQTLEEMARALFKSWFVDFDPVRAKAEGRDTGLPKHLADLFPDRLVDSELGPVPEGWPIVPVGEMAQILGGSTPSTKVGEYWAGGNVPFATPKDLSRLTSPVLQSTERCITNAGLTQIGSGALPVGTVLMSSRAPIGYLAIADTHVAINQGFIAMVPAPGVSNIYLLLWAQHAQRDIIGRANGSTFLEISKSSFREIKLVSCSADVMAEFDRRVQPFFARIADAASETSALVEARDNLLAKLLSPESASQV